MDRQRLDAEIQPDLVISKTSVGHWCYTGFVKRKASPCCSTSCPGTAWICSVRSPTQTHTDTQSPCQHPTCHPTHTSSLLDLHTHPWSLQTTKKPIDLTDWACWLCIHAHTTITHTHTTANILCLSVCLPPADSC